MRLRGAAFKLKGAAFLVSAALALTLPPATAGAASALRLNDLAWSNSSSLSGFRLDGRLAAAGIRMCQSLPGPSSSISKLSCRALQQTVQSGPYPLLWQMTQVMAATLVAGTTASASARQHYASELYATLERYADGRPFSSGLTPVAGNPYQARYYDDNVWVGLDLLQAYRQSGQPRLLRAAEGVLKFETTGEWQPGDPPDEQRHPGGIYWNTYRRTRPVHSTAGAAQVALELHTLTHSRYDLQFAEQEYQWVRQTLSSPTGYYRARVSPGGTVTGTTPDNGDGLMIGAGISLYHITGQKQFLNEAVRTARASLRRFTPSILEQTCPAFNAGFFYNLLALNRVVRLAAVTPALNTYARWVAQQSDPQTGAFGMSFPVPCSAQAPQAGATGALILQAIR